MQRSERSAEDPPQESRKNGSHPEPDAPDESTNNRIQTYIAGLDEILGGGLPEGRVTAIIGGPGAGKSVLTFQILARNAGKSVLTFQILARNAMNGTNALFRSFEQGIDHIRQDAAGFGWPLDELEKAGSLTIGSGNLDAVEQAGDADVLQGLLAQIKRAASHRGVKIIVLDGVDILLSTLSESQERSRQLRIFNAALQELKLTTLLAVKGRVEDLRDVDFMVDCVIHLDQRVTSQVATRRLRILKSRGYGAGRNEYPFVINNSGVRVIPISSLGLRHGPLGEHLTSGIPKFDTMLNGGIRRASSALIAGTPGTAKTTIAATFSRARCDAGETVLWLDFEQSSEALVDNVTSAGVDLRPSIDAGLFHHRSAMPESMGAEEHLIHAFDWIEEFHPAHVVIDAISASRRMGSGRAGYEYALRLMDHCKTNGITCIMLNQTDRFMDMMSLSGIEISSMVDSVIALNLVQSGAELNRLVLVLKHRGSRHSHQFREFRVTDDGIEVLDVCLEMDGQILTGTARQAAEEITRARRQQKLDEVEALEKKIANLRAEMTIEDAGQTRRGEMRGADTTNQA